MASSSTSSIEKSYTYDVFISFRGKELRTSFVDHLYHALRQRGIIVFKDDREINKGEKTDDELSKAIKDSKFHLVVFSERYADSEWCLNELKQILECQNPEDRTFYPIFYNVKPSEVREQKGAVGKAFETVEKNEGAGIWRAAMEEAAILGGWELAKTGDGHEVQFIKQTVDDISKKPYFSNFDLDANLVGVSAYVEKILLSLQVGVDDVRMIGLKGMGGIGKTTLASVVFNRIANQFDGKCFVENVRKSSKTYLQKQVLTSVLGDPNICVPSFFEGLSMMKRRMARLKVLVVLDDVDNVDQLEALAGEPNWFKPGSRIIITTRDEQVLVAHGVEHIHDVNMLSNEEALYLFSRHAFKAESPNQGYEDLSKRIVNYAAGLPLTIKVLGSFLSNRPKREWVDAIERLKRIPEKDTLKTLEISYDGLEPDYKQMFLHVACLLKGKMEKEAVKILDGLGFHPQIGLRVLEQKCLITLRRRKYYPGVKEVVLHDLVEEMGVDIVRRFNRDEPHKHMILWKKDEIEYILVKEVGTEAITSIQLQVPDLHPAKIFQGLRKMTNLRFLYISERDAEYEIDEACGYLPNTLRFLHWHGYHLRYLPKRFEADNLIYLEIRCRNFQQLWEGEERKVLSKLRFLDLSQSKLKTFELEITPNLERLVLEDCPQLVELNATAECRHLKELNLRRCMAFKRLNISNKCPYLEKLTMSQCLAFKELQMQVKFPNLKSLNFNFSGLTKLNLGLTPNLEHLHLRGCNHFAQLHMPVECPKLKTLHLSGFKLSDLNPGLAPILEKLQSLEELELLFDEIERLPDTICMLQHLKHLSLRGCSHLKHLPDDLGRLECLERLILENCSSLQDIPNSICKMKSLKTLNLGMCCGLKKLPAEFRCLKSLEWLVVRGVGIEHLFPNISQLKGLEVVNW